MIAVELKSEKSIIEHLKTLPDDTIIKYYLDVEWTPFPILIINEYQRRFKRKTKDEILKKLTFQSRLAKRKAHEITSLAKKRKFKLDEIAKSRGITITKFVKKKRRSIRKIVSKKTAEIRSKKRKKVSRRKK